MNQVINCILDELGGVSDQISEEQLERLLEELLQANRIFGAGAGRSGLMVRAFVMRLMHLNLQAYVAGETVTPSIRKGDLLVIGSRSGETRTMLIFAEQAKAQGAKISLLTSHPESTLASLADIVVTIPTYPTTVSQSSSIQPLGSQFEQALLVTLDSIILFMMTRLGVTQSDMLWKHANLE